MNHSDWAPAAGILAGLGFLAALVALAVGLAIAAFICYLLVKDYERIPAKHRTMEPSHVWFNLIPCVPLVFNFWVFPGLAKSFKAYFNAKGDATVGDCGENIGLWYSICCVVCLVPYLNILAGLAALILLVLFLVKANDLKNKIPLNAE